MATTTTQLRAEFFDHIFEDAHGYVCICYTDPDIGKSSFEQRFFSWPAKKRQLNEFIEQKAAKHNLWFCVNLLQKAERKKEFCLSTNLVWSDLDTTNPEKVEPAPPIVIQSSPGRFQALWRLDERVSPDIAEDYSKRIAYGYRQEGADTSGWDLTQLLRVPYTFNFKYTNGDLPPEVVLLSAKQDRLPVELFEGLPQVGITTDDDEVDPAPDPLSLPDPDNVIYKYYHTLMSTPFKKLYEETPRADQDWSGILWHLINICLEAGMSRDETFAIAMNAGCNKYRRDDRPMRYLWRDVLKADRTQTAGNLTVITGSFTPLVLPEFDTDKALDNSFVDDYRLWASQATDAIPEFHDLSAFIMLSAVFSGSLRLEANYGTVVPNLWGLILGDSTLTRKSTAMRLAMDILLELDSDILLATDGSAEGLLTGLQTRPNKPSVFFRDEVTGFVSSINKKEYLSGMPEMLTHLYDVPQVFQRRLRKETITINSPIFIFFGGGIRDRMYELLSEEYVLSGFLPRFLVVSGEADLARIRRTGPPGTDSDSYRRRLKEFLEDKYEAYNPVRKVSIGKQSTTVNAPIQLHMSPKAWEAYADIEDAMVKAAWSSDQAMLALPTFERLSRSLLKMSMLIAATRCDPVNDKAVADEVDVATAAKFVQSWGRWTIDLLHKSGRRGSERLLDKVLMKIAKNPEITRGRIGQSMHLSSRELDEILKTLEDRQLIVIHKQGRGVTLRAVSND
jgi:hypothetical protein